MLPPGAGLLPSARSPRDEEVGIEQLPNTRVKLSGALVSKGSGLDCVLGKVCARSPDRSARGREPVGESPAAYAQNR